MNDKQLSYLKSASIFSIIPTVAIIVTYAFEPTRAYTGILITALLGIWGITAINIWIFKEDKDTEK